MSDVSHNSLQPLHMDWVALNYIASLFTTLRCMGWDCMFVSLDWISLLDITTDWIWVQLLLLCKNHIQRPAIDIRNVRHWHEKLLKIKKSYRSPSSHSHDWLVILPMTGRRLRCEIVNSVKFDREEIWDLQRGWASEREAKKSTMAPGPFTGLQGLVRLTGQPSEGEAKMGKRPERCS